MTDLYAVIGNPVSHSKSPLIHAEFARQTGQDLRYEAILAPLDGFREAVWKFEQQRGKGLNVTIPFKHDAWLEATKRTERAELAQAVNTLKFEDGEVLGDNTDGAGLVQDIKQNLRFSLRSGRILLMGAGGAAHSVMMSLLEPPPLSITIANRTVEKAFLLESRFKSYGSVMACAYPDIAGKQFDIVINATSSSLFDEIPPLPPGIFAPGALAYDMVYGKGLTPFLRFAKEQGAAKLADGTGMLVEQAAESFFLWRGVRPETAPVIKMLKDEG